MAFTVWLCAEGSLSAQTLSMEQLSVPQSSAFKLVDISPSLIETPTTAKAFGLSVLQNFKGGAFPSNYAAEFTPYWWLLPKDRNVYRFIGLMAKTDGVTGARTWKISPFSGIKFTNVSLAFLQKDMVPDTVTLNQQVFSFGVRSTLIKIHQPGRAAAVAGTIEAWGRAAASDIEALVMADPRYGEIIRAPTPDMGRQLDSLTRAIQARQAGLAKDYAAELQQLLIEKPMFQWDIAMAYAVYGMDDSVWKTGRTGVWSTASLHVPLYQQRAVSNYLSLAGYVRYMHDRQYLHADHIGGANAFDIGGKLAFEFRPLSIGVEAIRRNYAGGEALKSQRTVGFISYQLRESLYINAAFGDDFGVGKSAILTMFGLNWGFGEEKLTF